MHRTAFLIVTTIIAGGALHAQQAGSFRVEEATVAGIHAAMRSGTLTCRQLVEAYLARIDAYDKKGPSLNAIVVTNVNALRTADSLDARFRREGPVGPLHCIPTIVKDNFETTDLPTTAGSLSLEGFISDKDATMVKRVRDAGGIVLAKSNMAEFAFSPQETVNSIMPGHTRNPYDTSRVTAGSSGGTAAAVAASFGAVGLGTDTGNSIRGPSSHQALVGIRSTMGLTSRAGVVPLSYAADIAGPMTRTVADAVAVFQVVAGYDPEDPITAAARSYTIPDYSAALLADGLRGARIGVLRQAYDRPSADPEVLQVFAQALEDMRKAGATVLDSVIITEYPALSRTSGNCNRFKFDFEKWIASTGGRTPVKSLAEVVESGKFHPSVRGRLQSSLNATVPPEQNPGCESRANYGRELAKAMERVMDSLRVDALVYPTWSNPPRPIETSGNIPTGDNSQIFSPATGWPSIQVPMGYTVSNTLPAGITILGRAWSEPVLIKLAYSFEQATKHRRAPLLVPPSR